MIVAGFDVEIHQDLTSKQMNDLKRSFTEEEKHRDSNCFLLLVIRWVGDGSGTEYQNMYYLIHYLTILFFTFLHFWSHGTADNFIQCSEGTKAWNIESLVTEVSAGSMETYL